jgi:hypothetical protein
MTNNHDTQTTQPAQPGLHWTSIVVDTFGFLDGINVPGGVLVRHIRLLEDAVSKDGAVLWFIPGAEIRDGELVPTSVEP